MWQWSRETDRLYNDEVGIEKAPDGRRKMVSVELEKAKQSVFIYTQANKAVGEMELGCPNTCPPTALRTPAYNASDAARTVSYYSLLLFSFSAGVPRFLLPP